MVHSYGAGHSMYDTELRMWEVRVGEAVVIVHLTSFVLEKTPCRTNSEVVQTDLVTALGNEGNLSCNFQSQAYMQFYKRLFLKCNWFCLGGDALKRI